MEIAGYEIENLEFVLPVYLIGMTLMLFLFKFWIKQAPTLSKTFWSYYVIIAIIGLPVTYLIIQHYANK